MTTELAKGTIFISDVIGYFGERLDVAISINDNPTLIKELQDILKYLMHVYLFYPKGIIKIFIDSGVITYCLIEAGETTDLFKITI